MPGQKQIGTITRKLIETKRDNRQLREYRKKLKLLQDKTNLLELMKKNKSIPIVS